MTYTKPNDIRYVDCCIWIDENAYSENCDETKLYEYLYHLSLMFARKGSYFTSIDDYDQFALFAASRLFMRLRNPKQWEVKEDGQPKLPIIKSILNYIKKVIYPYKADFDKLFGISTKELPTISIDSFNLGAYLVDTSSTYDHLAYSFNALELTRMIRLHLQKIPYKKNSPEWINIYISCMLTLLDSITFSKKYIIKYEECKRNKDELIDKIYTELRYNKPILYHLDKSMANYISVLVTEIRHSLAAELSWESQYYISPESVSKELLEQAFNEEGIIE